MNWFSVNPRGEFVGAIFAVIRTRTGTIHGGEGCYSYHHMISAHQTIAHEVMKRLGGSVTGKH